MVTRKVLYVKLAKTCLVAAVAAGATFAANAADANGVKLKVTGVAVVDDTYEGKSGAKFLPPETRVLPGHGEPTTVAAERELNPYLARLPGA